MSEIITIPYMYKPYDHQIELFAARDKGIKHLFTRWHRRCLIGTTPIAMSDGTWKNIKDINVGDKVLSFNGTELEEKSVVKVFDNGKQLVSDYSGLVCTSNHKVLQPYGNYKEVSQCRELVEAGKLSFGSYHNPELAEVLGLLLTDGYVKINQTPKFTNVVAEVLDRFEELVVKAFPEVAPKRYKKGNGFDIVCPTIKKTNYHPIRKYFKDSNEMPEIVWSFDEESMLAFLSGVITGDGSFNIRKTKVQKTQKEHLTGSFKIEAGISKSLAESYRLLLLKFGIRSKIIKDPRSNNHRVVVYSLRSLHNLLGIRLVHQHKKDLFNLTLTTKKFNKNKTTKIKIGNSWEEDTYDITVEDNHNYIANGYIVHNCGKDLSFWNLVIKEAVKRKGIYYYVFPQLKQGKKALFEGMTNDGTNFMDYIPKSLRDGDPNSTELKIKLSNGSLIQIIGTDKYDKVRGTNPVGVVYSEFAYQNPGCREAIRPILLGNNGWEALNSCITGDSLILGESGLKEIGRPVGIGWTDISEKYFGLNNEFHEATGYFYPGKRKTIRLTTSAGYEIEGTPEHPLWDGNKFVRLDQWKIGDKIPIQRNQQIFGTLNSWYSWDIPKYNNKFNTEFLNRAFNTDLMYELGLILGDGYVNYNDGTINITSFDIETQEFLLSVGYREVKTNPNHYEKYSKVMCDFLKWFGFKKWVAKEKEIPKKVFQLTKELQSAFLSGYFDADGWSDLRGRVGFGSASKKLTKQLQVLLLNYGIISLYQTGITPATKKVKVESRYHRLEIGGYNSYLFFNQIGFRLTRKQERINYLKEGSREYWSDIVDVGDFNQLCNVAKLSKDKYKNNSLVSYKKLKKLNTDIYDKILNDNFYYTKVVSLEDSSAHVYDFHIPDTHSFFSNGFISSNTPNGKNHMYMLETKAQAKTGENTRIDDRWFISVKTIDETYRHDGSPIFTQEMLQSERDEGYSEEFLLQEYYVSYQANSQGYYYLSQVNNAREEGRIGNFPWIPDLPVYTYWDIGVGDSTAIWFLQWQDNMPVFIDFYQSFSVGIDHYASVLLNGNRAKYAYKQHLFPHDMNNTEFGTGKTRLEIAYDFFGTDKVEIGPKLGFDDGIQATRTMLNKCRFNESEETIKGISAIENYQREYNDERKEFSPKPKHDWASHPADALRYCAIALERPSERSYITKRLREYRKKFGKGSWKLA